MRAVSILAVVFGHSFGLFERLGYIPYWGTVTHKCGENVLELGIFGVELFFVLSGFLIGNILIKTFLAADNFTFSDVRQFWVRRWFRTLPNYWLILTVNIILYQVLHYIPFEPVQLKAYVFLQNLWYPNMLNSLPEGWSLSVEEWFYLTLPVAMCLLAYVFKPVHKVRLLFRIFIGYLLVFLLVRVFNAINPINGFDPDEGIRKVVVFRLDAVMYGVVMAYLVHVRPLMMQKAAKYLFFAGIAGIVALFYLVIKYDFVLRPSHNTVVRFLDNAFLYMVMPLVCSLCLPFLHNLRYVKSKLVSSGVSYVSKISYSVYLVHFSLVYRLLCYPIKVSTFKGTLAVYIFYWVVVFVLSGLIYRYFEFPVMKLRDRFTRHPVPGEVPLNAETEATTFLKD